MKDRDKIYLEKRKTIYLVYTDREKRGKKGRREKYGEGENNFVQVSYFSDISFFSPLFAAFEPQPKQKTSASRGFSNDRNVICALYGSVLIPRL